jgi:2-polyprenyl-6-methoxyphenol hydroxylase-like FAD-dependent oxidoreductase
MKSRKARCQVLIAGAGATGLTAALLLAKSGVNLRIIEKKEGPSVGSKEKGINPLTLELLHLLGLTRKVLDKGSRSFSIRIYSGSSLIKEIKPSTLTKAGIPFPQPVLFPQDETEALIRSELLRYNINVEYGFELTDVVQDDLHVTALLRHGNAAESCTADYLIGCDGGKSDIRKLLGLSMQGKTLGKVDFFLGDLTIQGLKNNCIHLWLNEHQTVMAITGFQKGNVFQFIGGAAFTNEELPNRSCPAFSTIFERLSGMNEIRFSPSRWTSSLSYVNAGIAQKFQQSRVFLAGDAAHIHSPVAGHGLNTGVQDVFNLCWKLALVCHRKADPSLLLSYEEERMPAAKRILNLTCQYHQFAFRQKPKKLFYQIRSALDPALSIDYRHSSTSVHLLPPSCKLVAGDRMPDLVLQEPASSQIFHLFDRLSPVRFTLVVIGYSERSETLYHSIAKKLDLQFIGVTSEIKDLNSNYLLDMDNKFHQILRRKQALIVVRPDGYIGMIAPWLDEAGISQYFQNNLRHSAK